MSSEAAYFPDALASTPEALGLGHRAPEIPSDLRKEPLASRSGAEERTSASVIQIPEISDELLFEQVREGTKEALGALFRRHARSVRNVAYRILRNDAEADDLVQEVFLFIFQKAALFDSSHWAARSWIIHVTYHRAFDRRRYLNSRHFYTSQELDDTACETQLHVAVRSEDEMTRHACRGLKKRGMDAFSGRRSQSPCLLNDLNFDSRQSSGWAA
jgi:RNA polymerase sigma-70 factor (ECF subfamily)